MGASPYRPSRWKEFREGYRYTGKEDDYDVGLTYFGARYYVPGLNRWASADPLAIHGLRGDINPYSFVRGSPFRLVDPTGLLPGVPPGTPDEGSAPTPPPDEGSAPTPPPDEGSGPTPPSDEAPPPATAPIQSVPEQVIVGSPGTPTDEPDYTPSAIDIAKNVALDMLAAACQYSVCEAVGDTAQREQAQREQSLRLDAVSRALGLPGPGLPPILAAEGFEAIGSTGKVGEQALQQLGGESQAFFRTSQGGRFVDQLVDGVAHESKVGYQSLTPTIARQIGKDAELLGTGQVSGYTWHFFESPVTGLSGPSAPLRQALEQAGIDIVEH